VSKRVDSRFPAEEHAKLLAEVREYLPLFLHRGATEQHDPVGDVCELFDLEPEDLARVTAVHQCLDPAVLALGAALREGLRRPVAASIRPPEVAQSVSGPIDWAGTVGRRALEGGNSSIFVVRGARRIFDTSENRALVWLLKQLTASVDGAVTWVSGKGGGEGQRSRDRDWSRRIATLRGQLADASRVPWLSAIGIEAPTPATLRSLRATRSEFYAQRVAPALESVLDLTNPSAEVLTEVLSRRYFRPEETWRLFEVAVALRLVRAFAARSPHRRKTRLLVGEGRASFARYSFAGGSEVTLMYQAWPERDEPSMRRRLGKRHALGSRESRPDIFVVRSGPDPDAVILELKASFDAGYLRDGLTELLGYLADHPGLWASQPSGWLVAPASGAFRDEKADPASPLWIVSADRVASAVADRFTG
jgi:hypothetical protein